jgi:DNA-binding HxlR family transcriptional regulator
MRSYGQYCPLAKALDVIGDRWTLLIIRELLLRGACRYTDLRNGLPGIATNLLADRLRALEAAGLLEREEAPPPVASTLLRLTARGERLRPVLDEIVRWGIPYMVAGPDAGDVFRSQWLAWPAELFLTDSEPDGPPIAIELRAGEGPMVIETSGGAVHARAGRPERAPDAVLSGAPPVILGVLSGELDLPAARDLGLSFEGDERALARVRPAMSHELLAADAAPAAAPARAR